MSEQNSQTVLHEELQELRRMRDEIRLSLHLGSMEIKQRWKAIEPDAEKLFGGLSEISRDAVSEMRKRLQTFRKSVADHAGSSRST